MFRTIKLTALTLLVAILAGLVAATGYAASKQQAYHFEIVDQTIHAGQGVVVNVRLIQAYTGKPEVNATITGQKLLMMMGKMEPMPAPVKALPLDTGGNYQFVCDVTEPGDWKLDLSAQVPGEKEPIEGAIKFHVVK